MPKQSVPFSLFRSILILSGILLSLSAYSQTAEFVGTTQCIDCHENQYKAWQGSHHDMAMRHASPESVKGDFNNVSITPPTDSDEQAVRFYKKENEYWAYLKGADNEYSDYQIKYTFGLEPLQQYMVEFPDGRVQLIPYAWDSRTKSEGGQRWFYLYPNQTQNHQEFFWTNTGQNWNYMCADCHSTNLKKNFDVETNTYDTTFSEINVGCEGCHGPASEHIEWSKNQTSNKASHKEAAQLLPQNAPQLSPQDIGFNRDISKPVNQWVYREGESTLQPDSIKETQQTLVCAQCHSRHLQISERDHVASNAFGERYLLSLINSELYYPDGQIYDEDYVYGSFLQSKMSQSGVVCSNCHDPHSAELIVKEEAVCLQCHLPQTYNKPEHHHHPIDSEGAQCVNCHMAETTYMQIDKRRDHRWHTPRPKVSKHIGSPDTCLSCHEDKDSNWSDKVTQDWYPNTNPITKQDFAPVFYAIEQGYAGAVNALANISQNTEQSNIIRASALERMKKHPSAATLSAIKESVKDPNEFVRVGAIRGAEGFKPAERFRLLSPLLKDKVLAVRIEAAPSLAPLWQQLSAEQKQLLTPALNEYIEVQDFNADRGFSHTNKANIYRHQGLFQQAIDAYKMSIKIEPYYTHAYINLADLYRIQQQENLALETLKQGIKANPSDGNLPYSLGLAYVRNKNTTLARNYFKQATEVSKSNAHFHYVYGLSLEDIAPQKAQQSINTAYKLGQNPRHLYALCEMQIRHQSFNAKKCLIELKQVAPADAVKALEQQLKISNKTNKKKQ